MKTSHIAILFSLLLLILSFIFPGDIFAVNAQSQIIVVANANDSGPGSFRNALESARYGTVITFNPAVFPLDAPQTILLESELPPIEQDGIMIDASQAGVILDGSLINALRSTNIDDIYFLINGEVVLHNDFSEDTENWQHEAPDSMSIQVGWQPEGSDDNPGSLLVSSYPVSEGLIVYHDLESGKSWQEMWARDSSAWFDVQPGDTVTVRYRYRGAAHKIFFSSLTGDDEVTSLDSNYRDPVTSTDWRLVERSATVTTDRTVVFPTFQFDIASGIGLEIQSNHNQVLGLTFRNFSSAIWVYGDENVIGEESPSAFVTCSDGCNRVEGIWNGFKVFGENNTILGNWIGLDMEDQSTGIEIGISVEGNSNRIGLATTGNRIFPIEMGILVASNDNQIAGNAIGSETEGYAVKYNFGIGLVGNASNNQIGPNNRIEKADMIGIGVLDQTPDERSGNVIFENELLGVGVCGIAVAYSQNTTVRDNFSGIDRNGNINPNMLGICVYSAENTIVTGNTVSNNLSSGVDVTYSTNSTIGPGNVISANRFGVDAGNNRETVLTENSIFDNHEAGIYVWHGEDENFITSEEDADFVRPWDEPDDTPLTPRITTVALNSLTVVGKTEPNAEVDIFYDQADQGAEFVTHCTANRRGRFLCKIPSDNLQLDKNVTAVALRPGGGTSSFSEPYALHETNSTFISYVVPPLHPKEDAQVILISFWLAAALFFVFNMLAEIITGLIDISPKENTKAPLALWLLIILGTALAESFLGNQKLFSFTTLNLVGGMLLVTFILNLVEFGTQYSVRRFWKMDIQVRPRVDLVAFGLVVFSIFISRLLYFVPGIIVGVVGTVFYLPTLAKRNQGKMTFWVFLTLLLVSLLTVSFSTLISDDSFLKGLLENIFLFGVQSVIFGMLPYPGSAGMEIKPWNQYLYYFLGSFSLATVVLMIGLPFFTDIKDMRANETMTLIIISSVMTILGIFLWTAKKWHWFEKKPAHQPPAAVVE